MRCPRRLLVVININVVNFSTAAWLDIAEKHINNFIDGESSDDVIEDQKKIFT